MRTLSTTIPLAAAVLLTLAVLLSSCFPAGRTAQPLVLDTPPPGQRGPTAELLQGGSLTLTTRRTSARFPDGNRIWKLDLRRDGLLLASWDAVSGSAQRQDADRLWSPGNAAPLPAGRYRLGPPEPWGDDLWLDLQPLFNTTRSALGIHRCYPGTGCICIPSRADLNALAAWVKRGEIRALTVIN